MNKIVIALICGILFGVGLSLSQMLSPDKVQSFLDLAGDWDPSLIFVMLGALTVTIPTFRFIRKREKPVLETSFHISHKTMIDKPLLLGAALFGMGWGLTGYCPGPAVSSLSFGSLEGVVMVLAIYAGFFTERFFVKQ